MGHSSLRPFIGLGLAYFLVAVVVPVLLLRARREVGRWTIAGIFWSLAAGVAGAFGALGIILTFKFGGKPIFVMPLVFGGAPVVNTLVTMAMARSFKQVTPVFLGGIVLVAVGAAGVLVFKPGAQYASIADLTIRQFQLIVVSIVLTILCWGTYGPILHKGQQNMEGSRLRPFLCVGLAYFAIALLVLAWLSTLQDVGHWTVVGLLWSLAGGAAGAFGALGILMAFNVGGKPIYVMPLVFGGAPVVNTFVTMTSQGTLSDASPLFLVSLLCVIAGAVTVLLFAPPSGKKPEVAATPPKSGN
jgi:hypothetical protein